MDNDKKYLYKDIENLKDSSIFKDNVLFKLTSGEYTTYEYYQDIFKDEDEESKFLNIKFDSCYDNIYSSYDIVYNPEDDVIINYRFNSKYMYSYAKPYMNSNKHIINRETKSIGYKNDEICNSSRELYHLIFSKNKNSKLININKEFFKGDENDGENPKLNTTINIRFEYEDGEIDDEYSPIFINGIEEYTLLDKNGNIEDHTKSRNVYADTSCGEMICVHKDFDYMSSKSDKDIIIPYMGESTEDKIKVNYIRKSDENVVLSYEEFYIEDDGTLTPIHIHNNMGDITIKRDDKEYRYTTVLENNNTKYTIEGSCNYPLSCNIFAFSLYRNILGFTSLPYFDALYHTDINGEIFIVKNKLYKALIEKDGNIYAYEYEYDENGVINKQLFNGKDVCKYNVSILENGNKFIESLILAEPVFPINKKSIFYRAIEVNDEGFILSDYRTVAISHKNYNI